MPDQCKNEGTSNRIERRKRDDAVAAILVGGSADRGRQWFVREFGLRRK